VLDPLIDRHLQFPVTPLNLRSRYTVRLHEMLLVLPQGNEMRR